MKSPDLVIDILNDTVIQDIFRSIQYDIDIMKSSKKDIVIFDTNIYLQYDNSSCLGVYDYFNKNIQDIITKKDILLPTQLTNEIHAGLKKGMISSPDKFLKILKKQNATLIG